MFEDEIPKFDFTYIMPDGSIFCDSVIFSSWNQMRNTNAQERLVLKQQRVDAYLAAIEAAQNASQEQPPNEEPNIGEGE